MSITELGTPSVSPTHTISLLQFAQLHHDDMSEGNHLSHTWAGALESINRHEYHAMADQQKGWLGERQLRKYPVSDKYTSPPLSSFTHHLRAYMVANTFGIHSTWSFQWLWETPHPNNLTQGPLSSVIQCKNTIHHFSFTEGRSV